MAKCPICGASAYIGFVKVECEGPGCLNYHPPEVGVEQPGLSTISCIEVAELLLYSMMEMYKDAPNRFGGASVVAFMRSDERFLAFSETLAYWALGSPGGDPLPKSIEIPSLSPGYSATLREYVLKDYLYGVSVGRAMHASWEYIVEHTMDWKTNRAKPLWNAYMAPLLGSTVSVAPAGNAIPSSGVGYNWMVMSGPTGGIAPPPDKPDVVDPDLGDVLKAELKQALDCYYKSMEEYTHG